MSEIDDKGVSDITEDPYNIMLKKIYHSLQSFFDQYVGLSWTNSPKPKLWTPEIRILLQSYA